MLPASAARLRAQLFAQRAVLEESTGDDGSYHLRVSLPPAQLQRLCRDAGLGELAGAADVPAVAR